MHRFYPAILLVLLPWFVLAEAAESPFPMVEVAPKPTDEVLLNPGMGLYLPSGAKPANVSDEAWFFKIAQIVYLRMGWSIVEPEEGADMNAYFGPIFDEWVGRRKCRVAFRVMSESMHSNTPYVTPKWVLDKGVPSVRHIGKYGQEQFDPVFWNPEYLDQCCRFIERLGRCLDGRPGLEYIDIGQIGEWGEMHLGLHIPDRWTDAQLAETGFTRAKYVAAYRRVIDAFARAFPRTQVFLNVGSYAEINEYAAIKGIHFRQDGLTPNGPSANVGELFYKPWSRRGIKGNYEFHSGLEEMNRKGWDLHATIAKGLEAPISYLNTNILSLSGLEKAPEEVRRELTWAASRIGYRFAPTRVKYLRQFHVRPGQPARVLVEHTWKNLGVAPCYESYAIRFSLDDAAGHRVAESIDYPRIPTTRWWPGEEVALQTLVEFPTGIAPGDYRLNVGMFLPERPHGDILLAIEGRDAMNQYQLGTIRAVAADAAPKTVYQEDFEHGAGEWQATAGVETTVVKDSGNAVLALTGRQEDAWGFAGTPQQAVLPICRYRLSCRMKVDAVDPEIAPTLKLGVHDASGKHLTNHTTNRYDLRRMGTWQELSTSFLTDAQVATGMFSLEKGGRHPVTGFKLQVDDIRLILLESP